MNSMSFPRESFDVIWCEGAAFVMGFGNALDAWKPLLRSEGYLVISELVWFAEKAPQEIRDYFERMYPDMKFHGQIYPMVESAGYRMIDYFQLPDESWWTEYYTPAENNLADLRRRYKDNADAQAFFDAFQTEINMHRKYSRYYGYGFYVMNKERV